MNDSQYPNDREQKAPEEPEQRTAQAFESGEAPVDPEIPPVGFDIFQAGTKTDPSSASQWYRVSYQGPVNVAQAPKKQSKKGEIAVITAWVVMILILAALAGYVGAMLYSSYHDVLPSDEYPNSGNLSAGSNTGLGLGEEVFGAEGNAGYQYGGVMLEKNDGSALANSTTGSAGDRVMTKIEVSAAVKDTVVEITTTATSNYGSMTAGAGSGVIIHADGIIVTNNHVIEGAERVYVRLTNGNTYEATVRGVDEDGDIAIIKIDPKETLCVAKLGYSGALVEGEEVIAIGNPLGELGGTVTDGIISQVEREVQVDDVTMTLLQTNAAINSGNSGGGLFNMAGELIGVVNAKYSAAGVEGLGFAIPIDTAVISINHLLQLGYIPNIPSLGVTLAEGTVRSGFTYRKVVYVYNADESGAFEYQDIFVSVEGVSVSSLSEVKQVIRSHRVGETVTVVVSRNGVERSVEVKLVEYIPNTVS